MELGNLVELVSGKITDKNSWSLGQDKAIFCRFEDLSNIFVLLEE